jgi:uncharacterized protein (UPF0335 family)
LADPHGSNGPAPADELRNFIERWERLQEEKEAIASDQKDVMAEAKGRGYDVKAIREIIRLRKLSVEERRDREAAIDTYKAALGMLDGTPLGHWAVQKLAPKPAPAEEPGGNDETEPSDRNEEPAGDAGAEEVKPTVDDARIAGRAAALNGEPVTANPFPAFDERRAAWDEAWCAQLGSDGMEIPDALKPAAKPKKVAAHEPA